MFLATVEIYYFFGGAEAAAAATAADIEALARKRKRRYVLPNGMAFHGTEAEYLALLAALRQRERDSKDKPAKDKAPAAIVEQGLEAASQLMAYSGEVPDYVPPPLPDLPELARIDWVRVAEQRRLREQQNALVALLLVS